METIKKEKKLCVCCMEEHEVATVRIREKTKFKEAPIEYDAIYEYCKNADEFWATEEEISENDIAMKDAYREAVGLLSSKDIMNIRKKYGISQTDLAEILGLGAKTITRYEGHQVQERAYDAFLRQLDANPAWFMELLKKEKDKISPKSYERYYMAAAEQIKESRSILLKESIAANYAEFDGDEPHCGNTAFNIEKLLEVIRYFANSPKVENPFKVKMMKLLWYTDALSYKRRGFSMTGTAYLAWQMGAIPVDMNSIVGLCKTTDLELAEGYTGCHFDKTPLKEYPILTTSDIEIIETIIGRFGNCTKNEIVDCMHKERACTETDQNDFIQYRYAKDLSLE